MIYIKNIQSKVEFLSFYILSFFIYCFIGWVYEVISMYCWGYGFVNRGFLHGPYLPIYGFCSLFFILILHKVVEKKIYIKKIPITPLILFISVFILSSVIEYSTSYILEKVFNLKLWDYYDYKYNLNGRISLITSIYFGIGGLIIFYIVQPWLNKIRNHINHKVTITLGLSILTIMIIDLLITINN